MSAIIGYLLSKNDTRDASGFPSTMERTLQKNARLDSVQKIVKDSAYLACGLQNITAESAYEKLPFYNEERGFLFSFDGILDNREALIRDLGLSCEPNEMIADGTIAYHAFLKWGNSTPEHFTGLFSFAVIDEKSGTVRLFTDPVASRCLYYYKNPAGSIFFSTLAAPIRAVCPEIGINETYMQDFLAAPGLMPNLVSYETPYSDVYIMDPGKMITLSADKLEQKAWFDISFCSESYDFSSADKAGQAFRALYDECVKDATRTSGEIGIAMSSGFDSATVGSIAADHLYKQDRTLYSYTYCPLERKEREKNFVFDERADVQNIASMHPAIKTHFTNNDGKNCLQDLEQIISILEMPVKAIANFPNLCEIYKKASDQGCRIVLSGQCGNSTVSHGYIDDVLCDLFLKKKYFTFLRYLNRYSKTVRESRKMALKNCIRYFRFAESVLSGKAGSISEYTPSNKFVKKDYFKDYPIRDRFKKGEIPYLESIPTTHELYRTFLQKKALWTYMGAMETKLGLYYGIVLRDPTKDVRMLRFCYALPYKYFAYMGEPRWLVRGNCRDLLPADLINDWMRYSVQNYDYLDRIERDWTDVKKNLAFILDMDYSSFADQTELNTFINGEEPVSKRYSDPEIKDFLFVLSAALFAKCNSNNQIGGIHAKNHSQNRWDDVRNV
ncbi:Glutamine amidotransferase domain-containing protein [Lachnospiraceae bacterium]|nr:Glutamine amidotransferase domain-containing protein [Lachnospiraceae bacterium]